MSHALSDAKPAIWNVDTARRAAHHAWLLEVTPIPTAAGRESRVVAWIKQWVAERADLEMSADRHGNLTIAFREPAPTKGKKPEKARPIYFTAHLDHPAFVVERVVGPGTLELAFRGGVMDDYFVDAEVTLHVSEDGDAALAGRLTERIGPQEPYKRFLAEFEGDAGAARVGDVATWTLPAAEIEDGLLRTNACDDLAALVAALAAMDELRAARSAGEAVGEVRLLFTRAEEVGFIGAIGACRAETMPKDAAVIALENSRAMPEAPIGAGPIVRVGDRLSVFSPSLTAAINARAEEIAGGSPPTAAQKLDAAPKWKWQRRLMSGGACEASVFCSYGYDATCLCLPLGNYHNMADLDAVQAGTNTERARVGREFVSISDFDGLVDLLIACGLGLGATAPLGDRLEKLWNERSGVLGQS